MAAIDDTSRRAEREYALELQLNGMFARWKDCKIAVEVYAPHVVDAGKARAFALYRLDR